MVGATLFYNQEDDSQGYGSPYAKQTKTMKTLGQDELQKKTLAEWDGRGLKINNVTDLELRFGIYIIAYKIYRSSQLNSVS